MDLMSKLNLAWSILHISAQLTALLITSPVERAVQYGRLLVEVDLLFM